MDLSVVILAAGQGSRMQSAMPKVLHPLAGKPILAHVIDTVRQLNPKNLVIVHGFEGDRLQQRFPEQDILWAEQAERLGTGDAVAKALEHIPNDQQIIVVYGDVPLISLHTLQSLLAELDHDGLGWVTAKFPDPTGLGRIIRNSDGKLKAIVEERDATLDQKNIKEINSGIITAPASLLKNYLPKLNNNNAQGEYYLTDIMALAVNDGIAVASICVSDHHEVSGINDRAQLANLERYYQRSQAKKLLQAGVTLRDPARFDVRGELTCAMDVTIDVNVIVEGKVSLGNGVSIGPNCYLRDVSIGDNTEIKANSVIEETEIASDAVVGPFARLRPGTKLADKVRVGNFVEIKKAVLGEGSKVNHLSYIGDAELGRDVNVGAGTITCNYDGANKYQTIIQDQVFIGSNTALVAPITVHENATVGAGSTLSRDVPAGGLTFNRARARTLASWQKPKKV